VVFSELEARDDAADDATDESLTVAEVDDSPAFVDELTNVDVETDDDETEDDAADEDVTGDIVASGMKTDVNVGSELSAAGADDDATNMEVDGCSLTTTVEGAGFSDVEALDESLLGIENGD
jgi:hypothetical protein